MPTQEAGGLLKKLLDDMDEAWEGRKTLGSQMVGVIDQICLDYLNLFDYLKSYEREE